MKNSNVSEKSKGCLLFAFNTENVNYVEIADKTAALIKKFTNLPITLVTDQYSTLPKFQYDTVIKIENTQSNTRTINGVHQQWRNHGRSQAYDLSPYDLTLLVDCDLLILDDSLVKLSESIQDYRLVFESIDYKSKIYSHMGNINSLPFIWATVVIFKRTEKTKLYFDFIKRIERNYAYYKTLFSASGTFRNDYIFAMADIILKGYSVDTTSGLPWRMLTVTENITSMQLENKFVAIKHSDKAIVVPKQPIHVMDKSFLMSEQFNQFVKELIND